MTSAPERLNAALTDRYRIERELGQGGMATVYLAEDLKHKRKVALKVLKPELAAVLGAERFVQEITTTASLQHPHILPLFDSGTADGFLFYVMPFIQGETLRDKLNRETQLGVDEAVKIATDVADALHYAHSQGVIHRDIKPENILLANGRPMVADFGIALAVSAAAGGRMTETGLSLGTPHYMSPEQATAEKEITARSDVYSLASVLYETLAGEPPHSGGSAQQIIMKIITEQAQSVTTRRKSVPPNVAAAIAKALEKLPADRFASAKTFADALGNPAFTTTPATTRTARRRWSGQTIAIVSGVAAIAVAAAVWTKASRANAGPTVYDLVFPDSARLWFGLTQTVSVSHDGTFFIYTAKTGTTTQLWRRSLLDDDARPIVGTEGVLAASLSPDGKRIAFVVGSRLMVVPIEGGVPREIAQNAALPDIRWRSDTEIDLIHSDGRVLRVLDPIQGGGATLPVQYCLMQEPVAGGFLCAGGGTKYAKFITGRDTGTTWLRRRDATLTGGAALVRGSQFRVIDGRYLVYLSVSGDITAAPVDTRTWTVGRSVTLVRGIRRELYTGAGVFDITSNGTLIASPGRNMEIGNLVSFRPGSEATPIVAERAAFLRYSVSPDGRQLAAVVEGLEEQELRIYDLQTAQRQVRLSDPYIGHVEWDPLSRRIAMRIGHERGAVLVIGEPSAGAGLDTVAKLDVEPMDWRSDGKIFGWPASGGPVLIDAQPNGRVERVLNEVVVFPSLSPDGHWLSYVSIPDGQVRLIAVPPRGARSILYGAQAETAWLTPTELVLLVNGETGSVYFYSATLLPNADPPFSKPKVFMRDPNFIDTPGLSFAVMKNGAIAYVRGETGESGGHVRVYTHWVAQMKRAVDEANK